MTVTLGLYITHGMIPTQKPPITCESERRRKYSSQTFWPCQVLLHVSEQYALAFALK